VFTYHFDPGATESGFGVVTGRFLCLLGPEASAELAAEVYRTLDTDAAVAAELLTALASTHGLARFAVVELLDVATRSLSISVRGTIALELEQASTTRLSGASDAAWISTEANGVNTLRLMLDGDVERGTQLPIRGGVVSTNQLSLDELVARPRARKKRAPRAQLATATIEATAQSSSDGNGWTLTLPDGSDIEVGLPVVIGRRPWSADAEAREVVHVVAPATKNDISGLHLELFVHEGTVHARDLNSTNGTIVRTKARPPRLLHSGGTTELVAGDILDVGEDFSIALGGRD
jgi:hypothetical protein